MVSNGDMQKNKTYEAVPPVCERYSRYDRTIIWEHPAEVHIRNGSLTPEYYKWREKLKGNKYAVRYPLGFGMNKYCKYAYRDGYEGEKLNYIETRKLIYVPLYCSLVMKEKQFQELKERLSKDENLLIIEVDGPHQESLQYYKEKYNICDSFIEKDTILVSENNIKIMLNDPLHPFGHGYCLAMALLDKHSEWNK